MVDNIIFGLEVMVIGFTIVLITLYLLHLILVGFGKLCVMPSKAESKKKSQLAQQAPLSDISEAASAQFNCKNSSEVVAAITAVISAYLDLPSSQFKIVSLQPSSQANGNNWVLTGRKRAIERRQDLAAFRREKK